MPSVEIVANFDKCVVFIVPSCAWLSSMRYDTGTGVFLRVCWWWGNNV